MLNKLKYIRTPIIMMFFMCFVSLQTIAQTKVLKAEINPLNRVLIFCSDKPVFSSDISLDKTKITIKIEKGSAVESAKEYHGQGIIQDVYIQNFKNFAQISIILKEKRGYSANYLPFSQSLMIEVFDWKKLSPEEDDFRTGLLALENGITGSAKNYFTKSFKQGYANAAGFLGIIELQEGLLNDAIESLTAAEKSNSNISDFYAALAQGYSLKNDKALSDKYKKVFSQKSGLASYASVNVPAQPVSSSKSKEPISFLDKLSEPNFVDSSLTAKLDSLKANRGNDSAAAITSKKQDTIIKKVIDISRQDTSQVPQWFSKTAFYTAFAAILIFIMIISLYLRWRKQQLSKIRKETTKIFSEKLKTAQSSLTGSAHAAKMYKKTDQIIDDKAEVLPDQPDEKTLTEKIDLKSEHQKEADKNKDQVEQLALNILAGRSEIDRNDFESKSAESFKTGFIESEQKQTNPRLELAMHLHQEQMKLKTTNIETLNKADLSVDKEKLTDVAKKLGIEKSSLETKKHISDLESDKGSISKLAEKFGKK